MVLGKKILWQIEKKSATKNAPTYQVLTLMDPTNIHLHFILRFLEMVVTISRVGLHLPPTKDTQTKDLQDLKIKVLKKTCYYHPQIQETTAKFFIPKIDVVHI